MPIIDKRGVNQKKSYQILITYGNPIRQNYLYWTEKKNENEALETAKLFAIVNLPNYRIEKIKCLS